MSFRSPRSWIWLSFCAFYGLKFSACDSVACRGRRRRTVRASDVYGATKDLYSVLASATTSIPTYFKSLPKKGTEVDNPTSGTDPVL